MQTGSVGRGAQGWPPARLAGGGSRFEASWPNLLDSNQVYQQALMKVEIEIRESRLAPAHLGHGDVVVSGMLSFARMLVLRRVRMVHMRVVSVAVKQLRVEMDAPGLADVSIGVHMHVQAAELHGQEAHARSSRNRVSQLAHGENCITLSGVGWCYGRQIPAAPRLRTMPSIVIISALAATRIPTEINWERKISARKSERTESIRANNSA